MGTVPNKNSTNSWSSCRVWARNHSIYIITDIHYQSHVDNYVPKSILSKGAVFSGATTSDDPDDLTLAQLEPNRHEHIKSLREITSGTRGYNRVRYGKPAILHVGPYMVNTLFKQIFTCINH